MTIVEQAAYLKGLAAGLGMEPNSRDGKLWAALTELVSDMAHEIEDLQASSLDLADAVDELSDEFGYLEELTLSAGLAEDPEDPEEDEDEDEDGDFEDEDDELYVPDPKLYEDEPEEGDDEELPYDGVLYDVTCPSCGREISFDEKTLDEGSITCPGCGEVLEFDLGEDDPDDGK